MNTMNNNSLLATLFALVAFVQLANGADPKHDEAQIKQLRAQVFDRRGPSLGIETTFQLLEKLLELYENRKSQDQLMYRVRDLVMLRSMSRPKCNMKSFNELKSIIQENNDYKSNLLPYLQDCKTRRFNYCLTIIDGEVDGAVAELDDQDKKDVEMLLEEVEKAKKANEEAKEVSKVKRSPTIEGIVNFMRIRLGADGKSKTKLSKRQTSYVPELCQRVENKLKGPMQLFIAVQYEKSLIDQIDRETYSWLSKYNLCHNINLSKQAVQEEVFDIMIAHNGSGPLCNLFSCFFPTNKQQD